MYTVSHSCGQHDSFICVTWLIMLAWPSLAATCSAVIPFAFHMTYSYARHDSIICAPWVIYMWDMTQYLTASRAVTRQRHHTYEWVMSHAKAITVMSFARDMAHPYVWHDPFICAERLIYVYRMTHLYVRNDSFIFVAWLIHLCDITHYLTVSHAATCSAPIPFVCDWRCYTGWWRLIGCLKLWVIFRKRATNYRALLRKMTYEDKASWLHAILYLLCVPRLIHTCVMNRSFVRHALSSHCRLQRVLQYVAVCCSLLPCVTVCCSVLHSVRGKMIICEIYLLISLPPSHTDKDSDSLPL